MGAVAGLLLMVYGGVTAYLGYTEIAHPHLLTPFATYVTAALGIILFLVGILHFKAPHKAFLTTIPILIYFHTQMYFNALFYFARPMWPEQIILIATSIAIILLSYFGYSRKSSKAQV